MENNLNSRDNEVTRKFILPKFVFQTIEEYIDFLELNEEIVHKYTEGMMGYQII